MDRYLTILIDSLDKKNLLLEQIQKIVEEQEKIVAEDTPDFDNYNALMLDKKEILDKLDALDDGFTSLYARISPALKENPLQYEAKIKVLQNKIATVSDAIALIQAREMRVQATIERLIKSGKPQAATIVNKSEAAMKYYRTMNRTNTDAKPIFINRKK